MSIDPHISYLNQKNSLTFIEEFNTNEIYIHPIYS